MTKRKTIKQEWAEASWWWRLGIITLLSMCVVLVYLMVVLVKDAHKSGLEHNRRVAICETYDAQYLSLYDVTNDSTWACYKDEQLVLVTKEDE